MEVTLYGAANEVTGSCFLLEAGSKRLLVDCGLFQGPSKLERLNYIPRSLVSKPIDAVLLTHGHLDHCGRLPLLVDSGYRGPIYMTEPTARLAELILRDAAKIQEDDANRENKNRGKNQNKVRPLYTDSDVSKTTKQFRYISYDSPFAIGEDIAVEFVEAGHILGSACLKISVFEDGKWSKFVFSGDLGQPAVPILRDPEVIEDADVIFMESTYGDRDHRSLDETVEEFAQLIEEAVKSKGKVLIPVFAVGRTQLILYYLAQMIREKRIPPIPIYLDSPMAIAATEIYDKHVPFMDDQARALYLSGEIGKDLATLKRCVDVEESKALNEVNGPCIIMAGAGMCNAGRILHHLRHNVNDPNAVVLIVGFQPKGSLGRALVEGATTVKILGETLKVRCKVRGLGGFSAHAGQSELLEWLKPMVHRHPRVILAHGEANSINVLSGLIQQRYNLPVEKPKFGETLIFAASAIAMEPSGV